MAEFRGGDINAVVRLVCSLSDDPDAQLSILTYALVTGCRSCEVDKEAALEKIGEAFDADYQLHPLDSAECVGS